MSIKAIFTDVDNTILPKGGRISDYTRETVRECARRGIPVVLATGRWFPSSLDIARSGLGIEDGYMLIANGSAVVRTNGESLAEFSLSSETAHTLYDLLHGERVQLISYVPRGIYRLHSQNSRETVLHEKTTVVDGRLYLTTDDDEEFFRENALNSPYKMEIYADDLELLDEWGRRVSAMGLNVSSSALHNREMSRGDAGKGNAVRWLTEYLGLKKEETMAFGDFTNDISMFENVGLSVAVGNALDSVKAAATMVGPRCEEDGAAKMIRKYVFGDESV